MSLQDDTTDWDTNDDQDTGTQEYKWQPGHSKRNYKLGDQDTNDYQDTGSINDDWDTRTQLQRGRWGDI